MDNSWTTSKCKFGFMLIIVFVMGRYSAQINIDVNIRSSDKGNRQLNPITIRNKNNRARSQDVDEETTMSQQTTSETIPKIVHQEWKSHQLYPAQQQWRDNCKRLNPDWEFRIWNDTENRQLIEQHYSWFLETYDSYPKIINRVDAIRIFYLAHFGGIYMDLDYTCLKPFDPLLQDARFVVAEDELNQNRTSRYIPMTGLLGVGNSFMAGVAGHEIWVNATRRLKEVRYKVHDETGELAGVWFIRQLIQGFRSRFTELAVKVLPMQSVSPMSWNRADHFGAAKSCTKFEDLDKCRSMFPNSSTVSFWTGTWQTSGKKGEEISRLSWDAKRQAMLGLRGFDELHKDIEFKE